VSGDDLNLADNYKRANCCKPGPDDKIFGYYNYQNEIVVHQDGCPNLNKVENDRVLPLKWDEILKDAPEKPDDDYDLLEEIDFRILKHHLDYGVDYSLKVARMINSAKQDVFNSHTKLRDMKLLSRVKKLIIRYRKGIVDNKWIKHRNHTYYELTDKGKMYLKLKKNKS
jgi:Uncharacterized protein conserved in archaea (DUF2250)